MDRDISLTPRERQIMEMVILEGARDVDDIGNRCNISPRTVKNHFANLYRKLGVNSKTEAMSLLLRTGHIELPYVYDLREKVREQEFVIHCFVNYGRAPTVFELSERGFSTEGWAN